MNSIYKLVPKIIAIMALIGAVSATASTTTPQGEVARILQATQLYSQAVSEGLESDQRKSLLTRSESILLDVIAINPQSLDAHRKLMGVYLQMRDYRRGIETLQDAISLSPEDPKLYVALAILYDHQSAYEYASAILDEALLLDPNQQVAREFKSAIQQKIATQNITMESTDHSRIADKPHSK
jgi:tetratricopeptide (TPR) repeat protein